MDKSKEKEMNTFWHSASHLMTQAVLRIFKDQNIGLGVGVATNDGFYQDYDIKNLRENDLRRIEKEMKKIANEKLPITSKKVSKKEALKFYKNDPYKTELVNAIEDDEVTMFTQGEFDNLCKGPHVKNTSEIKAFKLLKISSAYWRGDEKNKQLTRIYGIAFPSNEELKTWKEMRAKAEANDHNKLGKELKIFMTSDLVGQGLPLFMPRGTKIYQILTRWIEDEEEKRGYVYTKTPIMAKSDLYKVSGHWDHYKDGMFIVGDEKNDPHVLALRPMTCPFQFQIYNNGLKSYRDLPIKYAETSPLFRKESSGEMHGITRVSQFTLSEGHVIVTPEQLEHEFKEVLNLINYVMDTLGIREDITYRFSKWDPENKKGKYIDNPKAWAHSEAKMKEILDDLKLKYVEVEGDAAFYGPKLDLQTINVYGKEDTLITVQIDFALPERFDMNYIDKNGKKQRPYIIHRSSIGCYERTIAMLIEKFGGAFPLWLSPEQAVIIPVSENFAKYAKEIHSDLIEEGIRSKLDDRNETLGYRIREAQKMKVPYIVVVGEKEVKTKSVAVRNRKGKQEVLKTKKFLEKLQKEIKEKK
jgi:threonyl-tRNA synthetase